MSAERKADAIRALTSGDRDTLSEMGWGRVFSAILNRFQRYGSQTVMSGNESLAWLELSNGTPRPPKLRYPLLQPKDDEKDGKAAKINALWKFLDGAKTPEELFGRAMCVVAAADLVICEVLPRSRRWSTFRGLGGRGAHSMAPSSHKDIAAKALARIIKDHDVEAPELKAMAQAWVKIDRDADKKIKALRNAPANQSTTNTEDEDHGDE